MCSSLASNRPSVCTSKAVFSQQADSPGLAKDPQSRPWFTRLFRRSGGACLRKFYERRTLVTLRHVQDKPQFLLSDSKPQTIKKKYWQRAGKKSAGWQAEQANDPDVCSRDPETGLACRAVSHFPPSHQTPPASARSRTLYISSCKAAPFFLYLCKPKPRRFFLYLRLYLRHASRHCTGRVWKLNLS